MLQNVNIKSEKLNVCFVVRVFPKYTCFDVLSVENGRQSYVLWQFRCNERIADVRALVNECLEFGHYHKLNVAKIEIAVDSAEFTTVYEQA